MKKWIVLGFIFAMMILGSELFAQCPMCKMAAESNLKYGGTAGFLFFTGILLFSGSLYLLSTQSILNISIPLLGPITPLGGSLLIFGWLFTALGILKK